MLDVLHISDSTFVCSTRAWDGSRRFLAGRVDGEARNRKNLGKESIPSPCEASPQGTWERARVRDRERVRLALSVR